MELVREPQGRWEREPEEGGSGKKEEVRRAICLPLGTSHEEGNRVFVQSYSEFLHGTN